MEQMRLPLRYEDTTFDAKLWVKVRRKVYGGISTIREGFIEGVGLVPSLEDL